MQSQSEQVPGPFSGLSVKLISTIVFVILAVEVVIYLPSVANFRANWLDDKIAVGTVAVQVLDVVPDIMDLPDGLTEKLLKSAGVEAIAYRRAEQRQLIERADMPMPKAAVTADMRDRSPFALIGGALDTLFAPMPRTIRVISADTAQDAQQQDAQQMEVLVAEGPLREAMLVYSRNIFILSIIIAAMTAAVIFIFVNRSVIGPLQRIITNMTAFRRAPENGTLIINASRRTDEIGVVERELATMESDIFSMLRQSRHLADLGLAVAKINHDLRNMLTSAQLLSDQVATLEDPKVQRLAPRLVQTLDKATGFAQSVLDYGRQSNTPPRPQPVDLHALLGEAMFDAGLIAHPTIKCHNNVPDAVTLRVDPDQMARVFVNLMKNAREALEAAGTKTPHITLGIEDKADEGCSIFITDNGPGLPPRARENLFIAFEGSARAGGTGLGLSIARELAEANGGKLAHIEQEQGTRFEVWLPRTARLT